MTEPTQVPEELIAGDTWEWTREIANYPASSWSGVWYFEKDDRSFSVPSVASGVAHTGTVSAATSADIRAGRYRWRFVATRIADGVRKTAESGWSDVLPDPAADGNADHRTTAQVILDNIEAYLRDPGNLQAASYSIGGRSLSRIQMTDLLAIRDKLKGEIAQQAKEQRLAAGLGTNSKIRVRFVT